MRKYSILTFLAMMYLVACNAPTDNTEWPEDLAGKKAMLKEKKTKLRELQADLDKLQSEIDDLDTTNREVVRKLVTTAEVGSEDFVRFVEIQGSVQSDESVMASSETGGRILSLNAEEGKNVRKGQLIAKVDVESIDKQIAELETQLGLAKDIFDRQKRLWDQNIGSEVQYLQAKNNKERLEKSLETIRFQRTKGDVYAPISGVINMVFQEAGELAGPGAPIVEILNTRKIKVVADVPESYLKAVKRGETVTVKFPALDMEKQARVSRIGNTINPANRTFEVEVDLTNSNGLLKPNLLAIMLITDFKAEDVLSIPLEIVQQEVGGKNFVYVAEKALDGYIAKKVYVETGESYEGNIIITKGLEKGAMLIMEGARGLANREPIKFEKPTMSPAASQG